MSVTEAGYLPAVIGHRGAAGHAPENTLAGLRTARDLGVACVEFDVMLTAEGTPVLFHDESLTRTTDGKGRLADKPWKDLSGLDAGSWFDARFAGERIPTLHQALAVLGSAGMTANIEIKPARGQDASTGVITAKTLQESWPRNLPLPVLSSFSKRALLAAADQGPEFPRALLADSVPRDWKARLKAVGAGALHVGRKRLTEKQARAVAEAGYALRVYTVNDPDEAAKFFSWGVDGLFSDFPDRITPP